MSPTYFKPGDTFYYGFSIYITSTWEVDSREDILFQWHNWGDTCDVTRPPSASLQVMNSGQWRLRVTSDANPCSTDESLTRVHYDLAEATPGQWHDFVFKMAWEYNNSGAIEAWHQTHGAPGWVKVLNVAGPNTYNDGASAQGYLKWGIYKPAWNDGPTDVSERVVFHDNVAVGATFTDANPEAGPASTTCVQA
jgi:hypothetical protein